MPAAKIHPSAFVDPSAVLGEDCVVGAQCHVGPAVTLGRGCVLEHHASVDGSPQRPTRLGDECVLGVSALVGTGVIAGARNRLHHHSSIEADTIAGDDNEFFPHAVIGGLPQDILHKRGDPSRLTIGSRNVFRECVTVNSGTFKEQGVTVIGDRNLFLAGAHIGHDSIIEDDVILVNNVLLGGHVMVERGAIVGGGTPLPPFLTVGRFAYVGGFSRVTRDVPPFMSFQGIPGRVVGANRVGLRRNSFSDEAIAALDKAYRLLFSPNRHENIVRCMSELEADPAITVEVKRLIEFVRASALGKDGRQREVLHQKWHPKDR